MTDDEKYMWRALTLAEKGRGSVSPNPMVGSVVVCQGKIIGEGYHTRYGEAHAEVNAIRSVKNQDLLAQSTIYVTLEPCTHFGKTPPCADLLIEKKLKKVVVAIIDPNPKVAGKGINKITSAGIDTVVGVCEEASKSLNIRFFTNQTKNRPYIILKWAESEDGFVARDNFDSKWISNDWSRQLVHKWRTEEDAILIGKNTAIYDNPRLTSRDWKGKSPVRILIDPNLSVPSSNHLFDGYNKTIIYNLKMSKIDDENEWVKIASNDFEKTLLEDLYSRNISSVIIEGGSMTLNNFINKNFWDEARVFKSPVQIMNGIKAPKLTLAPYSNQKILNDQLKIYHNVRSTNHPDRFK